MSAFKRPESVLVIVHSRCQQVLLLQRQFEPQDWQSVTGSLLPSEVPFEAGLRELKEETGLSGAQGIYRNAHRVQWYAIYPWRRFRYRPDTFWNLEHVFLFGVEHPMPITLSNEHSNFRWVAKEQALSLVYSASNRQWVKHFV